MSRGFIQVSYLIAIVVISALMGGGIFLLSDFIQSQSAEKRAAEEILEKQVDLEKKLALAEASSTAAEIEFLKNELSKLQQATVPPKPTVKVVTTSSRPRLSNAEIIEALKPGIVYVRTTEGSGSGMIIDTSGHILTNAHVVADVTNASITNSATKTYQAVVLGRDEELDLAILKISEGSSPVKLGNSDTVSQGDEVFTLGYPFGLQGDVSFKEGTISRRFNEGKTEYLETSAEIHPGNSGGALVNRFGEVIGVNTAAYGKSIAGITIGETIKFAIPINVAKNLIPDLKNGRNVLLPRQEEENSPPPVTAYDYTPPTITSITASRPPSNKNEIVISVYTSEKAYTSVDFEFEYSADSTNGNTSWEVDSDGFVTSFAFTAPYPAWHGNTVINLHLSAVDLKGNRGKVENYSVRLATVPGMLGEQYNQPLRIK